MATPRHITHMQRRVAPVPLPRMTEWGHPETIEERHVKMADLRRDYETTHSILRRKRIG
jgi:hypothetical protein